MKFLYLFCLFCFYSFCCQAQNIPAHFQGTYTGELQIFKNGKKTSLEMEFKLNSTENEDVFDYVLKYHSPRGKDVRNYILKLKDTLGNYILDEQNGIKIPVKYVNNSLHSFFKVQNNVLKSRISFYKNYAEFEISMAQTTLADTTSTFDSKFEVVSYPTATYQFAILKKQ